MNLYHILARPPATEKKQMPAKLEALAEKLAHSGRLRIDAGERVNFTRMSHPADGIYKTFSRRELLEPRLLPITERVITDLLERKHGPDAPRYTQGEIERLRTALKKHLEIDSDTEMRVARLVVQAAHPSVIMLILWEEVEIFVSFAHTVGDMLDIEGWQQMGASSGLQSTAGRRDYCVYISAGGNPFLTGEYIQNPAYDGPAAMARLMVIGGQEMGHFADIMRDEMGRPISRHSANISVTEAKDNVRIGRLKDQEQVAKIKQALLSLGLEDVQKADRAIEFYAKHRKGEWIHRKAQLKSAWLHRRFKQKCSKYKALAFIQHFPQQSQLGEMLVHMLADMKFNLAPVATAYQNPNPTIEEAIACAEALARVPQQALKWGHHTTRACYPHLYQVYYGQLIPAVVKTYEQISGQKYKL